MKTTVPQAAETVSVHAEKESNNDLQKAVSRLLRMWPWLLLFFVVSFVAAKCYLRYTSPIYLVNSRVILNDDENQQTAELIQIGESGLLKDDRKIEKEKEIMLSTSMIETVVRNRQLNTRWFIKGRVNTQPALADVPFLLEQLSPDSVHREVTGFVELVEKKAVRFNGQVFPLNTWVASAFGTVRWSICRPVSSQQQWILTLLPLSKAVSHIENSITATPLSKGSSIFNISIEESVPERGKLILDDLFAVYANSNIEFRNRAYRNTFDFVEQRLRIVATELKEVESQLQQYKSTEGVLNLSAEGDDYLVSLRQVDQQIAATEVQLEVLDGLQRYVTERNRTSDAAPATLGLTDPVLLNLLNQLFTAETELDHLLAVSGESNPEVQVRRQAIPKLKQSILASIANLRLSLSAGKRKAEGEISGLKKQISGIPQKERVLLEIGRQQQVKNSIFLYLLQKREESAIASAAQVANFRVIVPPVNKGAIAPKPMMVYGLAASLALMLYLLMVFVQVFLMPKVSIVDELTSITGLRRLGTIGKMPRREAALLLDMQTRCLVSEQMRDLRTNLSLVLSKTEGAKAVLVTSCISGEGKSLIARNLAATFAMVDKKVVLLEFDLRKSSAFQDLVKGRCGLMDYLCGQAGLDEIITPVGYKRNFDLLAAGNPVANPVDVLQRGNLEKLFQDLRQRYDIIIIDTPPVMPVSDAKLLAPHADLTLFIARQHYTPLPLMKNIADFGLQNVFPRPYLVVNGVKDFGKDYYAYGYGYQAYVKKSSGGKRKRFTRHVTSG